MKPVADIRPLSEHGKGRPDVIVDGKRMDHLPEGVHIPADALVIFLKSFEGPLDLLLHLIRRRGIDILHLPVADITEQYLRYVEKMRELRLDIAADYLVMAATLTEIKSRMLLPRPPVEEEEEEDPRTELIRRLLKYQCFREAAERIDELPREEREFSTITLPSPAVNRERIWPQVNIEDITKMLQGVLVRAALNRNHHVFRETLSVRERASRILLMTTDDGPVEFCACFSIEEGRSGVVVALLALLELMRSCTVEVIQTAPFASIQICRAHG